MEYTAIIDPSPPANGNTGANVGTYHKRAAGSN